MKKIVLALDFSPLAEEVERVGVSIARNMPGVALYFLTVINRSIPVVPPDTGVLTGPWESRLEQARERLEAMKMQYPELAITVQTFVGDPKTDILQTALDLGAGLLVIGTHGRTGWVHAVMGSNAEYMIRHATLPVLVVPGRKDAH